MVTCRWSTNPVLSSPSTSGRSLVLDHLSTSTSSVLLLRSALRCSHRPRPLGGGGGGNMGGGGPGGNNIGNIGGGGGGPMGDFDSPYNTYGLSTSFLEGLGIQGPLYNKIFIANVSILLFLSLSQVKSPQRMCYWYSLGYRGRLSVSSRETQQKWK